MLVLESIARDLRFALRLMRQTPIVSGVALFSLALGIGANVAIFGLVNALLLEALLVHGPERLVLLTAPVKGAGNVADKGVPPPNSYWTHPQCELLRDQTNLMSGLLAIGSAGFNLNAGGESRPAVGLFVSGRFFDVLGQVGLVTAAGLILGILVAIGAGRFVDALLFGLATTDATMIALAAVALTLAAIVAGYWPARRASRVDPMLALREN